MQKLYRKVNKIKEEWELLFQVAQKVGKQYISTAEKASGMMVTKEEILSKQKLIFLCNFIDH